MSAEIIVLANYRSSDVTPVRPAAPMPAEPQSAAAEEADPYGIVAASRALAESYAELKRQALGLADSAALLQAEACGTEAVAERLTRTAAHLASDLHITA